MNKLILTTVLLTFIATVSQASGWAVQFPPHWPESPTITAPEPVTRTGQGN